MTERLKQMGIPYSEVAKEMQSILSTDWRNGVSYAVKLKEFSRFFGQRDGDCYEREDSNGEVLWVVIRPDPLGVPELVTFMFRRRDQPTQASRFSVDKILSAKQLMKEKSPRA